MERQYKMTMFVTEKKIYVRSKEISKKKKKSILIPLWGLYSHLAFFFDGARKLKRIISNIIGFPLYYCNRSITQTEQLLALRWLQFF